MFDTDKFSLYFRYFRHELFKCFLCWQILLFPFRIISWYFIYHIFDVILSIVCLLLRINDCKMNNICILFFKIFIDYLQVYLSADTDRCLLLMFYSPTWAFCFLFEDFLLFLNIRFFHGSVYWESEKFN